MCRLVLKLEELDISGNVAAALATVARASLAVRGASARWLRMRWRPREGPENRGAVGARIVKLLVGVGVVLVFDVLMQERLPEVKRLVIRMQQALEWRNEWGHQEVVVRVILAASAQVAKRGG